MTRPLNLVTLDRVACLGGLPFFVCFFYYLVAVTIFQYIQDFGRQTVLLYTYSTYHSMSNIRVEMTIDITIG